MPICVNVKKKRNGPVRFDQGLSRASQDSFHMHDTLCLCLPTFPNLTYFASAKPIFKTDDMQLRVA